jgi:hypothetical protein
VEVDSGVDLSQPADKRVAAKRAKTKKESKEFPVRSIDKFLDSDSTLD